jgi:glucose-6-phosphate dehydrogenase assembly protein OpcA
MVTTAPIIPLQSPKDVSLPQIETELSEIWQSYKLPSEDGSSLAAARASTFTLLVYEPEETQHLLSNLGYYTGPIDGIGGPRTNAAIRAAQAHYHLPETGRITPELLQHLRHALAICRGDIQEEGAACDRPSFGMDSEGTGLADAIASENPCRIISLFPHLEGEAVTAQVSAYCPIQKQTQHNLMCCEYISLKGTEVALNRNLSTIKNLLIPELPSFLWWKATPTLDFNLFQTLSQSCTATIIDSSDFASDSENDLLEIHKIIHSGIAVSDLNWQRIATWQELAAEAFDSPERWDALLEVDRLTIDYEQGNAIQALLFLSWFASRPHLEWQPISRKIQHQPESTEHSEEYQIITTQIITFRNPAGSTIEAELTGLEIKNPGLVIGDIIDFRISSNQPNTNCCTILCSETIGCTRMQRGTHENCYLQQVSPIAEQSSESLLANQLRSWSRDHLYEESLAIAAQILQLPTA